MMRTGIFIIATIAILIYLSPTLAGVLFAGLLPVVVVSRIYSVKMRKLGVLMSDEKAKLST